MGLFELPKIQKAAVFEANGGKAQIKNIPVPEPKEDEALIKVLHAGVCHTDVAILLDELPWPTPYPYIGGHEGSGIVVKLGSNVNHIKVGTKVGIRMVNGMCMHCEMCMQNREYICPKQNMVGLAVSGTFEQYTALKAVDLIPLPDNIDMAVAAPVMCAGVTAFRGLKRANPQVGQYCAIIGAAGGVGSFAMQYAKAMGLRVVAIDNPAKKAHCIKNGAELFVDGFSEKVVETVQEITQGGPHIVVNLSASPKAVEKALAYARVGATLVLIGAMDEKKNNTIVNMDNNMFVTKTLSIVGSMTGTRQDTIEALELVARGAVKIPIEEQPLSGLDDAIERLKHGKVNGRVVLNLWK